MVVVCAHLLLRRRLLLRRALVQPASSSSSSTPAFFAAAVTRMVILADGDFLPRDFFRDRRRLLVEVFCDFFLVDAAFFDLREREEGKGEKSGNVVRDVCEVPDRDYASDRCATPFACHMMRMWCDVAMHRCVRGSNEPTNSEIQIFCDLASPAPRRTRDTLSSPSVSSCAASCSACVDVSISCVFVVVRRSHAIWRRIAIQIRVSGVCLTQRRALDSLRALLDRYEWLVHQLRRCGGDACRRA